MSIRKAIRLFCHAALFIHILVFFGCATYAPADKAATAPTDILKKNEAVVSSEPYEFHVVVLKDRELAKNYVGIDPFTSSMIPVFMKINNYGDDLIKIDVSGSALLTDTGEPFSSLKIDEAIERARRSDASVVGWTIAFGMVGAFASAGQTTSVNKSLEEDYHGKSFKPTLINSKASGEGLVFFNVPPEKQALINEAIIQLSNPISHDTRKVTIKF